jgi:nitroreductase
MNTMDSSSVFTVISTRRSIRKYQSKPISDDQLSRILEAGRLAPSAANRQPWHFLVITDPTVRKQMRQAYGRDWFADSPVILVVCADPREAWVRADGEEYWKVDAAIALQNMIMQATTEGLGTCWIGAFDEPMAKQILGIPNPIRVVAMTPLGYPDEEKDPVSNRKELQTLLHHDTW